MTKQSTVLAGALLFVFTTLVNAGPTVSFSETKFKTRAGEVFTVDVMMSEFPTTEGGGITVKYNPRKLQATNVTVDSDVWQFVNNDGDISKGNVSDILFSSFQGVSGDAKIATIEFQALHRGKSKIRLKESASNPFASSGETIEVEFETAKIHVRR